MKRLLVSLALFSSLFLSYCSKLPNNSNEISDPGSANISISIGKVGALGKIRNIELSKLYLTLSAPGETTIRDTFSLNGNAGGTYAKTYSNLASFLKTWTLVAESRDIDGNLIHYGDTSFIVPARSTIPVNLTLGAKYSMLKANFFPIRDSVTRCELLVNGTKQDDSTFAKQTLLGDTVKLSYNYLDTGAAQRITLNVYGTMWGFDTLLYTGDTLVTPRTGINASYTINLRWVGSPRPPVGGATMTVVLGAVGTMTINGFIDNSLEANTGNFWPMAHHDAQHTGQSPFVGPTSNHISWSLNIPSLYEPIIDAEGTIYIKSNQGLTGAGNLEAVNSNGSILWNYTFNSNPWTADAAPAIGKDGTIYFGTAGSFVALSKAGQKKWEFIVDERFLASPVIDTNGIVYVGSYGGTGASGTLYAFYPNGQVKWSTDIDWRVNCTPAIGNDGTIYVQGQFNLFALNPDGTIKWTSPVILKLPDESHDQDSYCGPSVAPDGTIYIASSKRLFALRPNDGSIKWTLITGGWTWCVPAIDAHNTVYITSTDGYLYSVSPTSGSIIWRFNIGAFSAGPDWTPAAGFHSPCIDRNNTIFVSGNSTLFAIDKDGNELWQKDSCFCTTPSIGNNGTLFCGTGGTLLKFSTN